MKYIIAALLISMLTGCAQLAAERAKACDPYNGKPKFTLDPMDFYNDPLNQPMPWLPPCNEVQRQL